MTQQHINVAKELLGKFERMIDPNTGRVRALQQQEASLAWYEFHSAALKLSVSMAKCEDEDAFKVKFPCPNRLELPFLIEAVNKSADALVNALRILCSNSEIGKGHRVHRIRERIEDQVAKWRKVE